MKKSKKLIKGKLRKNLLSLGIAILFTMFIFYAVETFYPSPKYSDFCGERIKSPVALDNEALCEENGGKWNDYNIPSPRLVEGEQPPSGWCNLDFYCSEEFNEVREGYDRNIFFFSLVVGLITIVVSITLLVEAVSAGFMGGGILLIFIGTTRFWGNLSDIWRTIMLGFALGVLVWVGYKKLS